MHVLVSGLGVDLVEQGGGERAQEVPGQVQRLEDGAVAGMCVYVCMYVRRTSMYVMERKAGNVSVTKERLCGMRWCWKCKGYTD